MGWIDLDGMLHFGYIKIQKDTLWFSHILFDKLIVKYFILFIYFWLKLYTFHRYLYLKKKKKKKKKRQKKKKKKKLWVSIALFIVSAS